MRMIQQHDKEANPQLLLLACGALDVMVHQKPRPYNQTG